MMKITTVTGDISPQELGLTSIHEHVLAHMGLMEAEQIPEEMLRLCPENLASLRGGLSVFSGECALEKDVAYAASELRAFKERVGGGAVCDASPLGLRGDVRLLQQASRESGVHLLCSTGLYLLHTHPKEATGKNESELTDLFSREIEDGIGDSGIRPGFVKCALGTLNDAGDGLHERERTALAACAKTATKYGLSLQVHTAAPLTAQMVLDAVDLALDRGVRPDKLLMLHMDSFLYPSQDILRYVSGELAHRTVSVRLPEAVLSRGVNISFDAWGSPFELVLPNDLDRAKGLVMLLKMGYEDQIMLGHDVISKAVGRTKGYYGFTRFAEFLPAVLEPLGYGEKIMQKLMYRNPAKLLQHG